MPNIGPLELFLILAVVVLLFGASKLPELARGSGRALRIFKTETKGLLDDEKDDVVKDEDKHPAERELEARNAASREAEARREADARRAPVDADVHDAEIHDAEIVSEREKRDTA